MNTNNFLKYLTERHKLSLRNIRTGKEIWHIFSSRLNMILATLTLIAVLFVVVLSMVAYTSILDFIPGYPGNRARQIITENIARLDSLENQVRNWELYNSNLTSILDGQSVAELGVDSIKSIKGQLYPRSESDSLLRSEIETDSNYMLVRESKRRAAEVTFQMVAPARGPVTKAFNLKSGMFGVEIAPQPNQSVLAVLDGTVILNSWDPVGGYTVVLEHAGNMVSIYKRVVSILCKTGQRVKSGEAIAMTSTMTEGKMPSLIFELWHNGNAVDPENYITF